MVHDLMNSMASPPKIGEHCLKFARLKALKIQLVEIYFLVTMWSFLNCFWGEMGVCK